MFALFLRAICTLLQIAAIGPSAGNSRGTINITPETSEQIFARCRVLLVFFIFSIRSRVEREREKACYALWRDLIFLRGGEKGAEKRGGPGREGRGTRATKRAAFTGFGIVTN